MNTNSTQNTSTHTIQIPIPNEREVQAINKANTAFFSRYLSGIAVGLAAGFVLANNLQLLGRRKAMTIGFMGLSGEYIGRKLGEFRAKDILNNELPKDSKWRNPFRGSGGVSPTATDIDSNKQQPFPSTEPPLDIFPTIPQKKPQRFNKYGDPIDD